MSLGFPRIWVKFPDPADPDQVFNCDLTWLTSSWNCIFGQGCPGIYQQAPNVGCCTLGAHFSDRDDEKRVAGFVAELTAETWQQRDLALKNGRVYRDGWIETEDGARKTRVVGDACIFHNDADFTGGYGCALHHLAANQNRPSLETKPDVCWQLPIRRNFETIERVDGSSYLEVTIDEYVRDGWGPGGADLDWYCTSNTEAHTAAEPVYLTNAAELIAMLGQPAYDVLAAHCAQFLQTRMAAHPASPPR